MQVLIADPQPTVRRALSIWISGQPGWVVIGEATDSIELLQKLQVLSPRMIILDHDLPDLPLKELVGHLRRALPGLIIILLTNGPVDNLQVDKLDVDYKISKVDPPTRMLETIFKSKGLTISGSAQSG